MASRAIQLRYDVSALQPNGDVVLEIKAIYTDTVVPGRTQVMMSSATLDVSAPATWTASIKQAMVDTGVANLYSDLTAAGCFVPTYA